jgi:MarR-like DNA-binding transcriptional regulator SgrR of sgrS sRNA
MRQLLLEHQRVQWLEEHILKLLALDDERKTAMNFPRQILDAPAVPLSLVSNKLLHLAAFDGMDTAERARWIRANLAAVNCTLISKDEARRDFQCGAELIRIDG